MNWINVEDKLPKYKKPILATLNNDGQQQRCQVTSLEAILTNSSGKELIWEDIRNTEFKVSHWAELPQMPNIK